MKLITFYGIEIDRKDIYDEKKVVKTNWLGQVVGETFEPSNQIKETIIYRKKYTIPADKIELLIDEQTQNSHKWLINGFAVEKNEYERVLKELQEI